MEDLTGRYLKALIDKPQSTSYNKGEYGFINHKYSNNRYQIDEFWTYTIGNSTTDNFQLMPIGFNPNQSDIPEYVECIANKVFPDSFTIGRIYKVLNLKNKTLYLNNDANLKQGLFTAMDYHRTKGQQGTHFTTSTKEAYDLQNVKSVPLDSNKPKSYNYEVVHCTTQEEWDFVTKTLNYEWNLSSKWAHNKKDSCINIKENAQSYIEFYQKNNYLIYSFSEWCTKFGHTFKPVEEQWIPIKGEWCYYLGEEAGGVDTVPGYWVKGEIVRFLRQDKKIYHFDNSVNSRLNSSSNNACAFRKCLPHEIPLQSSNQSIVKDSILALIGVDRPLKQLESMSKEELLAKAKRDYPIGTKYKSYDNSLYVVEANSFNIYELLEDNDYININAGICKGFFYCRGKWAEIISKPEVKEEVISNKKNVKDLVYRDVIHITNEGQWNKLKKNILLALTSYNYKYEYYLISGGIGNKNAYKLDEYTIYEYMDLYFPFELVNHSDVGLEYPYSCGSHDLNNTKIEYVPYTYNGNSYKHKSKVNELKVLSQQIPVVFKKKVKKHFLQTI